jgi:hypothetical protein
MEDPIVVDPYISCFIDCGGSALARSNRDRRFDGAIGVDDGRAGDYFRVLGAVVGDMAGSADVSKCIYRYFPDALRLNVIGIVAENDRRVRTGPYALCAGGRV